MDKPNVHNLDLLYEFISAEIIRDSAISMDENLNLLD